MNFYWSFTKCSILTPDVRKTTSNLLRINLKGKLRFNDSLSLEGAMYITLWQNFGGHPKNFSFMQFSQNIDGFQMKRFTGVFRTHTWL